MVEPDGSLRLATAVRDVGVGAYTMHCQVSAEVLGVEPELVQIDVAGTDGPYDQGVRRSAALTSKASQSSAPPPP